MLGVGPTSLPFFPVPSFISFSVPNTTGDATLGRLANPVKITATNANKMWEKESQLPDFRPIRGLTSSPARGSARVASRNAGKTRPVAGHREYSSGRPAPTSRASAWLARTSKACLRMCACQFACM